VNAAARPPQTSRGPVERDSPEHTRGHNGVIGEPGEMCAAADTAASMKCSRAGSYRIRIPPYQRGNQLSSRK